MGPSSDTRTSASPSLRTQLPSQRLPGNSANPLGLLSVISGGVSYTPQAFSREKPDWNKINMNKYPDQEAGPPEGAPGDPLC